MLTRNLTRGFCLLTPRKNPTQHFYMNHQTRGATEDWAWSGRIFLPKSLATKTASNDISSQMITILLDFARTRNPDLNMNLEDYSTFKDNSFTTLGTNYIEKRDFHNILEAFRENIVIKRHKLRHNREKRERDWLHQAMHMQSQHFLRVLNEEKLEDFVNFYCAELEHSISVSNGYVSKEVLGTDGVHDLPSETILAERQLQRSQDSINKKNDLLDNREENKTMVNSVMAFLHS